MRFHCFVFPLLVIGTFTGAHGIDSVTSPLQQNVQANLNKRPPKFMRRQTSRKFSLWQKVQAKLNSDTHSSLVQWNGKIGKGSPALDKKCFSLASETQIETNSCGRARAHQFPAKVSSAPDRNHSAKFSSCSDSVLSRYDPPSAQKKLPGLDAVYILHYPALTERRSVLEKTLKKLGLENVVTWVTWLNKEDITEDMQNCFFTPRYLKKSSLGAQSLNAKHIWVYQHVLRKSLNNVIVMEDDPAFETNIYNELHDLASKLPLGYSTLQLSGCLNMHAHTPKYAEHIYGPGMASRCASGYVISQYGARLMLTSVENKNGIDSPPDWLMNGVVDPAGYWYEPYMWSQTESGGRSYSLFTHDH